jgi:1,2-diacylglycerol 3-alpha-glucosyltransferase
MNKPIVMISSYPPRLCGIATFCEEAREFIQKENHNRDVVVISHTDGAGDGVIPIIDMSQRTWWVKVAEKIKEIDPHAVHIQHEYGLYEYRDHRGQGDLNRGFLDLLDALHGVPVVVEPHTVHGRLLEREAEFLYGMCERVEIVMFKCHYQKWRLDWNFASRGWETPHNVTIVPHGARPDKRWGLHEIPQIRRELGLDSYSLADHLVAS